MKSPQRRPPSSPPTFSRNVGASLPQSSPIPAIKLVRPAVPTFAHDSGASAQSRERDVNTEADELASDDEVRSPTGAGEWRCKWADCRLGFVQQPKLVHHLHTDHIGGGKDVYMCEWSDCMRKGQRQATRHSLITHCRAHTGERPYTCSQSGCGKTFTRSDAMNKHLRSLHGVITEPPNKKKVKEPQTVLTQQPLTSEKKFEWTPSSDADLLEDEEVAEVLPRLRRREMFWSTTEEDHRLVKAVRDRHPRGGHKGKGRDEDSDDSFDEGVGARYPVQPGVVGMMADQDEAGGGKEVDVMGRPRWQVRYIMGKAKLMLVEEENSMRRRELRDLMELERRMQAGERLEWCP